MALFKSLRGKRKNLPSAKTDGYAYFCTDDGTFWIDYKDENSVVQRKQLNAKESELLSGASLSTSLASSDANVPTSKAVKQYVDNLETGFQTSLSNKVDKETGKGLSSNDYTSGEKSKLAGIAANANNYSLPKAGSSLGGVQSGGDVSIANGLISYKSTMPIAKGGTGATTAVEACTNLGALPTAGGTMTGPLKLTKDVHYGATEPSNPTTGQMFLKEVNVAQLVYPVGAIYMSTVETNPSTLFGFGTWERIQDTFLLAAGSTYSAGSTGGEATHTLTEGEIPAHRHMITYPNAGGPYGDAAIGYPESSNTKKTWMAEMCKTESVGGGTAHNNMPPYLAVYVWKRTA